MVRWMAVIRVHTLGIFRLDDGISRVNGSALR